MSARARSIAAPLSTVERSGRLLIVRFARPHAVLSWAPIGGGLGRARAVAWRQVDDGELARDVDPEALLAASLAAADPPGPLIRAVGTINMVVQASCALAPAALAEVSALAAEARTAALLERRVPSRRTGRPSTGTGTDCIVAAAPDAPGGERWAGKHTRLGALVGAAARAAIERGVDRWLAEQQ